MKIKSFSLMLAAVAILLTGCWQKSVYPYYTDKDVFFEPQLLGEWREADKDPAEATTWTFTRAEQEKVYRIHIKDKETTLDLNGRLFKLGDETFMDMESRQRSINEIPAHHLFRVPEIGATVKIALQSGEFIKNWIEGHPNDLAHIRLNDPEHPDDADKGEYVLTADTARLQKFVLAHFKDEGFFDSPNELKKIEVKN